MDLREASATLVDLLQLTSPPVAIAFRDRAPDGVSRTAASEPAGCGYWRAAAGGRVFFTAPEDHRACPVGAHVHNVPLPPGDAARLEEMVQTMVGLEYLRREEVSRIPRLERPFAGAVYAPLADAPVGPDVVLLRGNARQMMLLAEAAAAAGVAGEGPAMGRPTCAVLPAALSSGKTASSFGCAGNRVYTGATEDEGWWAVPAAALGPLLERLPVIVAANRTLDAFHAARLQR
ncbi:MAG: DUF169 domain-containing protein [Candidatus Polarisedimenticolia bacterium]